MPPPTLNSEEPVKWLEVTSGGSHSQLDNAVNGFSRAIGAEEVVKVSQDAPPRRLTVLSSVMSMV